MATSATSGVHDVENQAATIELEPLLERDNAGDTAGTVPNDNITALPRIGEIPSIHKPGYGNWTWAEQQCARRCGFSIAEAKIVQEAYSVYQDSGNPLALKAFYTEVIAITENIAREYSSKDSRFLSWLTTYLPVLESFWTTFVAAIRSAESDVARYQDRLQLMETIQQLLPLLGKDIAPTTASSSRPRREEDVENPENHPQEGHIDITIVDQKQFKDAIQELLSSRFRRRGDGGTDYIIVGWFPKGSLDPREKMLRLNDESDLFQQMRKGMRSLRGWRWLLSLKSLSKFGLYKCDIPRGAHVKIKLSAQEQSILSHFILAYKASLHYHDADIARAWKDWVQRELNANNAILFEGKYSLELIYSWSAVRLSVAVITPTLFSFTVGLGYMLKTGDVSTAWTISSYIVTAAGAIVALLAILGSLKDS